MEREKRRWRLETENAWNIQAAPAIVSMTQTPDTAFKLFQLDCVPMVSQLRMQSERRNRENWKTFLKQKTGIGIKEAASRPVNEPCGRLKPSGATYPHKDTMMRTLTTSFLTSIFLAWALSACLASDGGNSSADIQSDSPDTDAGIPGDISVEDLDDPEPDAKLDDIPFNVLEDTTVVEDATTIEDVLADCTSTGRHKVPEEVGAVYKTIDIRGRGDGRSGLGQGLANSTGTPTTTNHSTFSLMSIARFETTRPKCLSWLSFMASPVERISMRRYGHGTLLRGTRLGRVLHRLQSGQTYGTLPANYPEPPAVGLNGSKSTNSMRSIPHAETPRQRFGDPFESRRVLLQIDYITAIGALPLLYLTALVTNEDDCVSEISVEEDPHWRNSSRAIVPFGPSLTIGAAQGLSSS